MKNNNRIVIITAAFTLLATFYSLSELHRISALHTNADPKLIGAEETVHQDDRSLQQGAVLHHRASLGAVPLPATSFPMMLGAYITLIP